MKFHYIMKDTILVSAPVTHRS